MRACPDVSADRATYGRAMEVQVTSRGAVAEHARRAAQEKLAELDRFVQGPLRDARVVLVQEPNPRIPEPAHAEAEVVLQGRPVRARAAAETMEAAVDEVAERLQRNLRRYVERMIEGQRVPAEAATGEWRHGSWSPPRPPGFRRPVDEREVVRRKSFAVASMSLAEAAAALDALDHAFFLFSDADSGADCVLYRHDDGRLALILPPGAPEPDEPAVAVERCRISEPIDLDTALVAMDDFGHRFLFFIDSASGRGNVVYLRYDGDYGLIETAAETS